MTKYLYGKPVAEQWRQKITARIVAAKDKGKTVTLAIVVVGKERASAVYAQQLTRVAESVGAQARIEALPDTASQGELLGLIDALNADETVTGILPMLPLPKCAQISAEAVGERIAPAKDVDCAHSVNAGVLFLGRSSAAPCTPAACLAILDYYGIELAGKEAVVLGRSNVVGKPVALLLLQRNATVTLCHSHTRDLPEVLRRADIVVAAVGQAAFIKPEMVKEGVVIIDVGINVVHGELCGDVDKLTAQKAAAFTPVPGGVGVVSSIMVMARLCTLLR